MKIRNSLYNRYLKNHDNFWYIKYKHYEKQIKKITTVFKKKYYSEYFNNHLRNAKKIWSGINEIIHNRRAKDSDIFIDDNGNILTDQKKVANKFNHFYKNISSNLVEKLPKPNTKYQDYLKNTNENSMYLNETDPGEVFKLLSKLDKAADIFCISPRLIKIGAHTYYAFLWHKYSTNLLNLGYSPPSLK